MWKCLNATRNREDMKSALLKLRELIMEKAEEVKPVG
jgi:hypothetical protein